MAQQPYDPVGALNGLFAPAYIHGNAESDQAVQNWMVAHPKSPGVGTFVPNATAAPTPVAQPAVPAAPAAPAPNRDAIAAQVAQNNQWATMRSQMSPQDIQTWQGAMTNAGRASEIPAFMNATYTPGTNSGAAGGYIAPPPYEPWVNAS
jgi:hypothetical protein